MDEGATVRPLAAEIPLSGRPRPVPAPHRVPRVVLGAAALGIAGAFLVGRGMVTDDTAPTTPGRPADWADTAYATATETDVSQGESRPRSGSLSPGKVEEEDLREHPEWTIVSPAAVPPPIGPGDVVLGGTWTQGPEDDFVRRGR
jgi:hypothetical protein